MLSKGFKGLFYTTVYSMKKGGEKGRVIRLTHAGLSAAASPQPKSAAAAGRITCVRSVRQHTRKTAAAAAAAAPTAAACSTFFPVGSGGGGINGAQGTARLRALRRR